MKLARGAFLAGRVIVSGEMSTGKPKQEGSGESQMRSAVPYSSNVTINHYVVFAIDQQSLGN